MSDLGTTQAGGGWEAQTPQPGGASGPRAGFGQRFLAWLVDLLVLLIPNLVFVLAIKGVLGQILSMLLTLAYYTYFEGGPTGQTIGKRVVGIRVIDFRAGGPIGYARGFLRWIGRYVSGIVILLGYFWMLWDKENQTWHDKIATTVVVPVDAYPIR